MKKLLLFCFILLSFLTYGQKEVDREWAAQVNSIFENLDKSKVPHDILLDYAMEFTNVPAYNGNLTDSTFVDAAVLGNIYKTLFMGKVNTDTIYFPKIENVAEQWFNYRNNLNHLEDKPVLVLSGLYYNYSKLEENALDEQRIVVNNNKYYDSYLNEEWQNPYEELQTIAYAPPIKTSRNKSFEVILPEDMLLSNNKKQIKKIEINFDDGQGYRNLDFDSKIEVNYSIEGLYKWEIRTTLHNNEILLSQSFFEILKYENPGQENVFIRGPNSPFPFVREGAVLRIDYAPGHNGKIKKPFIVAEGFDPGSIVTPEKTGGDRTLTDFLDDIKTSGNQLRSLLEFETAKEYDIIYIDWQNGMHDIKHNSEVLRNVIKWVNDKKQQAGSTEQNVLMGQSMGGLISRYTLAKMENEFDEDHDVRLFIAHDSPMRGANTPLSLQYFTRQIYDQYTGAPVLYGLLEYVIPTILDFTELMSMGSLNINFPSLDDVLTIQDTPAALQMNYHYVDINSNPTTIPHETWQNEFDAMDYPANSKNVAISNGNECAPNHGFSAGAKFVDLHDIHNPGLFGDLLHIIATPTIGILTSDIELYILGLLPGSSKYYFDFDLHSNPSLESNDREVYNGKIKYKKKFLWIIPITHTITSRKKDAPYGYLPFDIYSGGSYDILDVTNNIPFNIASAYFINPQYNFIPVASALDIRRNNQEPNHEDYLKRYYGGSVSYPDLFSEFDNFIVDYNEGQKTNNNHITFQKRNGNWLAKELDEEVANTANCSYNCQTKISGEDILCSEEIFSVFPGAPFYNWTVTEGSHLVSLTNDNTNEVTVTPNNTGNGFVTLKINYGDNTSDTDCGINVLSKRFWVGTPSISYPNACIIHPPEEDCFNMCKTNIYIMDNRVEVNIEGMQTLGQIENWEWEKLTENFAWQPNTGFASIRPYQNGTIKFRVRAKNECGWSDWLYYTITVEDCGPGGFDPFSTEMTNFTIFPNPAESLVNVNLMETNNISVESEQISGKLFDLFGQLKQEIEFNDYQAQFSVEDLNEGVYVLHIYVNDAIESYQLIVN